MNAASNPMAMLYSDTATPRFPKPYVDVRAGHEQAMIIKGRCSGQTPLATLDTSGQRMVHRKRKKKTTAPITPCAMPATRAPHPQLRERSRVLHTHSLPGPRCVYPSTHTVAAPHTRHFAAPRRVPRHFAGALSGTPRTPLLALWSRAPGHSCVTPTYSLGSLTSHFLRVIGASRKYLLHLLSVN